MRLSRSRCEMCLGQVRLLLVCCCLIARWRASRRSALIKVQKAVEGSSTSPFGLTAACSHTSSSTGCFPTLCDGRSPAGSVVSRRIAALQSVVLSACHTLRIRPASHWPVLRSCLSYDPTLFARWYFSDRHPVPIVHLFCCLRRSMASSSPSQLHCSISVYTSVYSRRMLSECIGTERILFCLHQNGKQYSLCAVAVARTSRVEISIGIAAALSRSPA